jgi:N-acetylneuraminate synthase
MDSEQDGLARAYVVAEAGVNHNGDPELALRLVDAAGDAGADAVKFQTFRAAHVVTSAAPKAEYQKAATEETQSQLDMLRGLELNPGVYTRLMARCDERGIDFLTTPFDLESLAFVVDVLGLGAVKLGSGEITNGPFLLAAAGTGRRIILSTGMSTLGEVADALGVLAYGYGTPETPPSREAFSRALESEAGRAVLRQKVTLLQCITEYPAPFADVNLRVMETLGEAFGLPVGLSDHSTGIAVPVAAAALGAAVIEKHVTLDRSLPGPDHAASVEPDELAAMVAAIRQVEEALGDGEKRPTPPERKNLAVARRSLVAQRAIRAGDPFTPDNLAVKRPGTGVSPMDYWDWLGRTADRDYAPDELVVP